MGPQTYARKLATDLVSWATKGDKSRVNLLCGDLLGWTNHIVDVSQHVTPHCSQENKKRFIIHRAFSDLFEKFLVPIKLGNFGNVSG